MKRFTIGCCLLTVYGATSVAAARSPIPIDHPTPPPCAADGTCYPNRTKWGYYPARWRTWPEVELEPTPSAVSPTPAEEGRISPELGPAETPPPELEDATPPPSSPKREAPPAAAPESGEAAPETDGTALPDIPLPDDETPPSTGPTSDVDPPPVLPFSVITPSRAANPRQAATSVGGRAGASRVTTHDPPPAPPWAHSASL